jgi:phosphoribosyl 1,2-cyclic phosphodiesterase
MNVTVLGSGSRGNALLLSAAAGTVLVDAGFPLATLARRAAAQRTTLDDLDALILTHEHADHARGAAAVAKAVGCPVYASGGTRRALASVLADAEVRTLATTETNDLGAVLVDAVRTGHDAAEPVALRVTDPASGATVGIASDVGRFTPRLGRLLRGADCLLLEANHDDQLLRTGPYPASVRSRIAGPTGHLSNWQASQIAAELWHDKLHTVVLVHLSERCNRPELARDAVLTALTARGFRGRLLVASQDRPLPPITVRRDQLVLDLFD